MRIPDHLFGAGFILAGAAIFAITLGYPRLEGGAPGPALFPQVLAVLMVGFGASLLISGLVSSRRESRQAAAPASPRSGLRAVVNALFVFAAIVVFMVVSPAAGFLLTCTGILLGLMWWLGSPPLRATAAAVGLSLFVYVVFGKVLRVPLPLGLLWF